MTHTARLVATEGECLAAVEAAADEDVLGALAADVAELAPGRWQVMFYFEERPSRAERAALDRVAKAALGPQAPAFAIDALADTDWVAKSLEGLTPVRAGRFLVHGGHDRGRAQPNDIAILIEAGEAFGTGHHGTTAGCLLEIERVAKTRRPRNALDVGTGSAVLAIGIAKLAKAPVLASDIDPVATRIAGENVRLNGVARRVRTITAAGLQGRAFRAAAPYDLIVANILAGPLVALAPSFAAAAAPRATLILSGLLVEQAHEVLDAYRAQGFTLERAIDHEAGGADWRTLVLSR